MQNEVEPDLSIKNENSDRLHPSSVSGPPIYAYSPYGLANRLLGLASTIHICEVLRRPMILIWEENACIGYAPFKELFNNRIETIPQRPSSIPVVLGENPQNADNFPEDTPIILECHDICKFPGLDQDMMQSGLQRLHLSHSIMQRLAYYTETHDIANWVGIHIRQGDKMGGIKRRALRRRIESQYDSAIVEVMRQTNSKIYLSCDDPNTWRKYKSMFDERIESFPKARNPLQRDSESIAEAVLDLFLLSKTKSMLYGVGTFGYAAHLLGGNKARNIFYGKDEFLLFFETLRDLPAGSFPPVQDLLDEMIKMAY